MMKPKLKPFLVLSLYFCVYACLCFLCLNYWIITHQGPVSSGFSGVVALAFCIVPFLVINWLFQNYSFEKRKNRGIRKQWIRIIQREENHKTLINRISDGFLSLDNNLHFTYANDTILQMTGKRADQVLNKHIKEVFPEALATETYQLINEALKEQKYICNIDYYPPLELWQENHIYPSSNGLSIFIRNISEKKKAELNTEKREKRFRALIEHSEDMISLMDREGRIIYISPAFERASGFRASEVLGRKLFEFMSSENVSTTNEKLQALLEKPGVLIHSSNALRNKQGAFVLMEGTVQNLLEDKNVEAIVCNFRDVTEQKKNEAHIQESEALYQNLFTNMMHGFMYGKAIVENNRVVDYTYMGVNDAYEKLTGIQNVIGKTVSQTIPEFLEANNGFLDALTRVVLNNEQVHMEIYVAPFKKWFSTSLYSPKRGYFVSLFDDITAKKKLDEQQALFASIITSSQDAILSLNESGSVTSWNQSAEKLLGYKKEEALGMVFRDFVPSHRSQEPEVILEKLKHGERIKNFETERLTKSGKAVAVSLTISPIIDEHGRPRGTSVVARDISEKKAAEAKIRFSENNLSTIIENSIEAFILTDKNLNIKAFNTKARDSVMLQFGEGKIEQGKSLFDHVNPERRQAVGESLRRVLEGETIHYESNFYEENGQTIWLDIILTPVLENSQIKGVCIAFSDITARKNAEEKITQSEENLRTIFENTTQGFILLDMDGTIKSFNDKAIEYSIAAYGSALHEGVILYDFIEPSRVTFMKDVISKVIAGETIQYNRPYKGSRGKELWLDFMLSPVWRNHKITGICITGNDITEKKRIEQEREFDRRNLESLINNTSDMMWSVDRNLQLITCNKPFEYMIRQATGEDFNKGGDPLLGIFGNDTITRYIDYYNRAFSGEAFTEVEFHTINGGRWIENSFYPIYNGDEVAGTACFARDITQRKVYEEDLSKSAQEKEIFIKELSQNNKDLQQFAYITSHNLRAPIASLLGLTNLLDNFEIPDPTLNKILDGIQKATVRFDETIRDLNTILTVKENSAKKTEFLYFEDSFKKAKDLCEGSIEENNVRIDYDFRAAPGIQFNKAFLESIFLNLLTNAIKYRDTSRQLMISTSTEFQGNNLILRFSDNGIGIDLKQHGDKLFKLYQRFHYSREGKGLGLFLIKSQLESFGASIKLESEPDRGATFIIQFPNAKPQSDDNTRKLQV